MTDKKPSESSVIIDPVAMNIVNKIAPGTKSSGTIDCAGGMLIQGSHHGKLRVSNGPLVLWEGSRLTGHSIVHGDAYIFGTLGEPGESVTQITVTGTLYLTSLAVAYGKMRYGKLSTYDGARIKGTLETILERDRASAEAHAENVHGDGGQSVEVDQGGEPTTQQVSDSGQASATDPATPVANGPLESHAGMKGDAR